MVIKFLLLRNIVSSKPQSIVTTVRIYEAVTVQIAPKLMIGQNELLTNQPDQYKNRQAHQTGNQKEI